MPRYIVERTFSDGLHIPVSADGVVVVCNVIDGKSCQGVTWMPSYISEVKTKSFCVYDGPNPVSIQTAAERSGLPVDRFTRVKVLDPHFYY